MKKYLIFLSLVSLLSAGEVVSSGEVFVNGKILDKTTKIKRGDTIETKANSSIRFNVANDAFSAKSNSKFKLESLGSKKILNVINGGVLSVFGKGNHEVVTPNMTAGIRGTGTYTLVKDGKTYFCTCYGHTEVVAHGETKDLKATHHNMIWVTKDKIKASKIMEGHTDDELRILEKMVGRTVPFD
ncbi:MAG: hypothetical protein ACJAWW_000144 [Sulfurimonas sp.]|jgi:hypothetical protein